jgi:hypothetical protein
MSRYFWPAEAAKKTSRIASLIGDGSFKRGNMKVKDTQTQLAIYDSLASRYLAERDAAARKIARYQKLRADKKPYSHLRAQVGAHICEIESCIRRMTNPRVG